jgi:hypothetical protein
LTRARPGTVYLVTVGEYSDYRVVGVFSSRHKAEAFRNEFPFTHRYSDEPQIEEYPLDPERPLLPDGWQFYRVLMRADGAVTNVLPIPFRDAWEDGNRYGDRFVWSQDDGIGDTVVAAPDEEGAVKIANERRIRWKLAQGGGGEP